MAGQALPSAPPPVLVVTDLAGTADTVPYIDDTGAGAEVALGSAGSCLVSQGPGQAPTFESRASIGLAIALGG